MIRRPLRTSAKGLQSKKMHEVSSEFKAESLGVEKKTDASVLQELTHRLKNDGPRAGDSMEANGRVCVRSHRRDVLPPRINPDSNAGMSWQK